MNKTVVFQVIDWDRMKKDEGIGEVINIFVFQGKLDIYCLY